jgi:hypothetical protein
MSGRKEKLKRKLEKERMENKNPQQQLGLQIISFLENYIQLCVTLTGDKPTSVTLTEGMYNSYIQESQRHGEVLGLKPGFKDDAPVFMGVKLEKKSPIITPDQAIAS